MWVVVLTGRETGEGDREGDWGGETGEGDWEGEGSIVTGPYVIIRVVNGASGLGAGGRGRRGLGKGRAEG